jgi:hypothetical protein
MENEMSINDCLSRSAAFLQSARLDGSWEIARFQVHPVIDSIQFACEYRRLHFNFIAPEPPINYINVFDGNA